MSFLWTPGEFFWGEEAGGLRQDLAMCSPGCSYWWSFCLCSQMLGWQEYTTTPSFEVLVFWFQEKLLLSQFKWYFLGQHLHAVSLPTIWAKASACLSTAQCLNYLIFGSFSKIRFKALRQESSVWWHLTNSSSFTYFRSSNFLQSFSLGKSMSQAREKRRILEVW
jgi:hypothetical protein